MLPVKRQLISDVAEEDWIKEWILMHHQKKKPIPEFVKVQEGVKKVNQKYFNMLKLTPLLNLRWKGLKKYDGITHLVNYNADFYYEHRHHKFNE